jgi:hypothetical protein
MKKKGLMTVWCDKAGCNGAITESKGPFGLATGSLGTSPAPYFENHPHSTPAASYHHWR